MKPIIRRWLLYYAVYLLLIGILLPAWWTIYQASHVWSWVFWAVAIAAAMTAADRIRRRFWS